MLRLTVSYPSDHWASKTLSHVICLWLSRSRALAISDRSTPYPEFFNSFQGSDLNFPTRTLGFTQACASTTSFSIEIDGWVFPYYLWGSSNSLWIISYKITQLTQNLTIFYWRIVVDGSCVTYREKAGNSNLKVTDLLNSLQ